MLHTWYKSASNDIELSWFVSGGGNGLSKNEKLRQTVFPVPDHRQPGKTAQDDQNRFVELTTNEFCDISCTFDETKMLLD